MAYRVFHTLWVCAWTDEPWVCSQPLDTLSDAAHLDSELTLPLSIRMLCYTHVHTGDSHHPYLGDADPPDVAPHASTEIYPNACLPAVGVLDLFGGIYLKRCAQVPPSPQFRPCLPRRSAQGASCKGRRTAAQCCAASVPEQPGNSRCALGRRGKLVVMAHACMCTTMPRMLRREQNAHTRRAPSVPSARGGLPCCRQAATCHDWL